MIRATALGILLGSTAGMAFAAGPEPLPQEPMVVMPVVAPVPFWEGGYVGGQVGYAYGDFSLDTDDFNDDGIIGGLTAGYLWSLNNGWYLGPEFQYDWADVSVTDGDGDSAKFDEIARLKLVAGREVSANGLLYGSLGFAYADFGGASDFLDSSADSWVAGIGYDYRLTDNWSLGGEYQYHDFDDVEVQTVHAKLLYRF